MIKKYTNGKWKLLCGKCKKASVTVDYNTSLSYLKCMCCGYKSLTFRVEGRSNQLTFKEQK